MQGLGRFVANLPCARLGDGVKSTKHAVSRSFREGAGYEIDDRDSRRCIAAVLHHRHRRGIRRRRQGGPECRWPELLIQRSGKCPSRRALRRDPAAVRREILRQLLRRQDALGDVSVEKRHIWLSSSRPSPRRLWMTIERIKNTLASL